MLCDRMSSGGAIVSMVGSGSTPAMLAARALLAGNGVAHRWIDTDTDPRVASAVGEGAMAIALVHRYLAQDASVH
jgi:hypothetical protein